MHVMPWETGPLFSITLDLDWASEDCIDCLLERILGYGLKPTIFITHPSTVIDAAFSKGLIDRAIHPNFLPNSTQGKTLSEVLSYVSTLVPEAKGTRSHAYVGSSMISDSLKQRDIRYDSSPLFLFQQNLMPLRHGTGIWHFPVFWEDDAHWNSGLSWNFSAYEKAFFMPGLKIIDVHPFFYMLNIPNADFYMRHKSHIPTLTYAAAKAIRYKGEGCAVFTDHLLKMIADSRQHRTLHQILDAVIGDNAREQTVPLRK